jgi:hypothetical protein
MRKSKQLRKEIDQLLSDLEQKEKATFELPEIKLIAKSARMSGLAAELAEVSTRRIICLTWGLVVLTIGLLAYTILIYEDAHKEAQSSHPTNQHDSN